MLSPKRSPSSAPITCSSATVVILRTCGGKLTHYEVVVTTGGSFAWVATPYFTVALATRGYPDEEIAAIVGGHYLRLLREVCG